MKQFFHLAMMVLALVASSCSNTIPTAASLDAYDRQIRARHQADYDALEQRRSSGQVGDAEYAAQKRALDQLVSQQASDLAWSRHALDQSQRKAAGYPTPDNPVAIPVPTAGKGGDSLYRPFSQQFGSNGPGTNTDVRGMVPSFGTMNDASTIYVSPEAPPAY